MQAQAGVGGRQRAQGASGVSPLLVFGIVLLAASLVAVGAVVVMSSLTPGSGTQAGQAGASGSTGPGTGGQPGPTPPARPTVGIFSVGRQDPAQPASGADPTPASGSQAPQAPPGPVELQTPGSVPGQPLISPRPPAIQPGSGQPASGAAQQASEPAPTAAAAAPATPGGPDPIPTALPIPPAGNTTAAGSSPATVASPGTAASPVDQAVNDAFARLTTDQDLVGQLLLLGWIGDTAEAARPELAELRAGGIVFVQNATTRASATIINQGLNQIARDANLLPPLIAIDHEGGIVQRIKDVENLGNNWDFREKGGNELTSCQRGLAHANTLRAMGFSMNLAPVLDVNNNPANPVIGKRSYSDDPQVVATLGAAYIRGLQGGGLAAVGKHFPGHGNTSTDSHFGLPLQPQSVADLDKIELVPFKKAIEVGIAGIMSAHIVFPAVDKDEVPATLSRPVMKGLLRDRLGYTGLTLSDDMGAMKAITDNFSPGDAAVRAVNAGVDMMILSAEVGRQRQARDGLLDAVASGKITRERLEEAVRHVLRVKAQYGLLGNAPAQTGGACQ